MTGDAAQEPDEFFTVVLSHPTNAALGEANAATVTIQADDLVSTWLTHLDRCGIPSSKQDASGAARVAAG